MGKKDTKKKDPGAKAAMGMVRPPNSGLSGFPVMGQVGSAAYRRLRGTTTAKYHS